MIAPCGASAVGRRAERDPLRGGAVLRRLAGGFAAGTLGAAILLAGAGAVTAKDLRPARAKQDDPRTAYAEDQYVKICSLYGGGFYYIPGTDTCIRLHGSLAGEFDANHVSFGGPVIGGNLPVNALPLQSDTTGTAGVRLGLGGDVRTQTQYGTLRGYLDTNATAYFGNLSGGLINGTTAGDAYVSRAFIQFAGFTLGRAQSAFDFFSDPFSYSHGFVGGGSDTSTSGIWLANYTAQFGNGIGVTISLEDANQRRNPIWTPGKSFLEIGESPGPGLSGWNVPGTCFAPWTGVSNTENELTHCAIGDYQSQQIPDVVGSLRVDQAWGSAQIAAALHQVRAGFTGGVPASDQMGWAVAGGVALNVPSFVNFSSPGSLPPLRPDTDRFYNDLLFMSFSVGQGAPAYAGFQQYGGYGNFWRFDGWNVAAGWALDGINGDVPGGSAGLILPTTWDVAAAIEHYWNPALRTSLFGSFTSFSPGSDGNAIMCSSPTSPVRTLGGAMPTGLVALPGCNFDFDVWAIGSRTIWNPVPNLDIGVEVMWSQINQNMNPGLIRLNFAGTTAKPAGLYVPTDEGTWSGMVRVQRNFFP